MPQDAPPDVAADLEHLEPEPIDAASDEALAKAALYMRAIRSKDREAAGIEADYAKLARPLLEDLKALDEWRDDRLSGVRRERDRLEGMLEAFGRAYKERFGHAPKRLAFGRITLTPPKDSLVVTDNDAFVDWAEGTDRIGLVNYKKTPDKDAVKAASKAGAPVAVPDPDPTKTYREAVTANAEGEPEVIPGVALASGSRDSASVKVDP